MAESDRVFVVTTRSRLRGPWYFPAMMLASLRIRRQLARTGDVVRWASIVAGPTEFWTITAWRSRHEMQEFMRSGAHDEIMWLFSRWLKSFWLMRWRPGPREVGVWKGMSLAQAEPEYEGAREESTGGQALDLALAYLPRLRSSTGSGGGVSYESTAYARRRRAEVGGAGGVIVHVRAAPRESWAALSALRRLRRRFEGDDDLLRSALGISRLGELYLLTVWSDRAAALRMLESPETQALRSRWPGCWANEWLPENEFGHWDGVRLRRARGHYAIPVPEAAMEAAEPTR